MNEIITIFTPTYNRAHLLERLYLSLIKQTNHSFIWLVVDDGSTDNTKELIEQYISEKKLELNTTTKKIREKCKHTMWG